MTMIRMKYDVVNYRTEEHLGRIADCHYTPLQAMLEDHFDAENIIFDREDPLPGVVNARIVKEDGTTIYEKIEVRERDIKKELNKVILGMVPFDYDDIVDYDQQESNILNVWTSDGKVHTMVWDTGNGE